MIKKSINSSHAGLVLALCGLFLGASAFQSSLGSTLTLDFTFPGGTVEDQSGNGTGFTTRLSGTDTNSPDPRLLLDTTGTGNLDISGSSTPQDFNGPTNPTSIEAPGINLSSLGFTGTQDFTLTAVFDNVPAGAFNDFGQLGIYVGTSASQLTRDGFVFGNVLGGSNFYGNNNNGGGDTDTTFAPEPSFVAGDTLTATISRTAGVFTETVNGVDVTPTLNPAFLNGASDLTVGAFVLNTDGTKSFTAPLDSFTATVDVPEPGTWAMLLAGAGFMLGLHSWRSRRAIL